ncbi:hypothetical protein PV04_08742 [Phialophora macrospora]|uniref:Uncharacterized protein n=1 Tax=Phialophora macrospora TaxID=1851006 RepID=A0A0D2FUL5_9EURO|nr:hypothetical protein PV04_08742 [Phialophora macrospora]
MTGENEFLAAQKKGIKVRLLPFDFDQHSPIQFYRDRSKTSIHSFSKLNISHGNNHSSNSNTSITMRSEIILSALAGTLFSQAFAAPLAAPAESAVANSQEIRKVFAATPVAAATAKTPVARRAADESTIEPFKIFATPVAAESTIEPFKIFATPVAAESTIEPFKIFATPVAAESTIEPFKVFATPVAQPVAKRTFADSKDAPPAKRDVGNDNDFLQVPGVFQVYDPSAKRAVFGSDDAPPTPIGPFSTGYAPPAKRAIAGSDDAPPAAVAN